MQLLGDAPGLLEFLFTADADLLVETDAMPKAEGPEVLDAAIAVLPAVDPWTHDAIEAALRAELIDVKEMKPRLAFGPLRSAIAGRRISPPLFESMELLGKESTLVRLKALRARL